MRLDGLQHALKTIPAYQTLLNQIKAGQSIEGLDLLRAARPFVVMALANTLERPVIFITGRINRTYNITEQLPVWTSNMAVQRFAESGALFYEYTPWSDTTIQARLSVLAQLCPPPLQKEVNAPTVTVTSARALMQKTLPVREFKANSRILKVNGRMDPEKLLRLLVGTGYEPATITINPGTFSRRGGIVDVFPIAGQFPVRIEFFGDEVDSLRRFDPATQRSAELVNQVVIAPAREALPRHTANAVQKLTTWFESQPDAEEDGTSTHADGEQLAAGTAFAGLEYYMPFMYSHPADLLDFAPKNTLFVIDDMAELRSTVEDLEIQALNLRAEKEAHQQMPNNFPVPYATWDDIQETLSAHQTLHLGAPDTASETLIDVPLNDHFSPGLRFAGQLKTFMDHLVDLQLKEQPTIVVTRQAGRIAEIWGHQDTYRTPVNDVQGAPEPGQLDFVNGALAEGWILRNETGNIHLLTDAEIFGWQRPEPRRSHRPKPKSPEASFADMASGDYVVHVEHGIGRFSGLQKRTLNGDEREFLVIDYEGTDQLFVPIHQADRIARYVGSKDYKPKLSRLGTADWTRVKSQTKKAVEDIARELLELYAIRANVPGYSFGPDTPWQHELEASFPYIETEDQLRAIKDVKQDMERPNPMDRLICGDVGYGKTEVALRAAFKAVMDGKQVAILVPTTVLAQQHYNTFSRRLTAFPVKVEMLSRFRDKRAQRTILHDLAEGELDIIIGTHRLLQDDVILKDLGLLIIDEEQRFGVTHKEKLKRLRTEVDVLTMTATPIPRTLYMALTGTRDISTIQTAPEERLPVTTHIGTYDGKLVRQAIRREMDRNGQVFFVHNRVQTIENIAHRLRDLVPEAKVVVAHGQMDEGKLEKVMYSFARGEFDVLVSTTIIESGVDIPNTNTMIIDRADWFGLAQLYQLRGRVGRGANRAYAYFFHAPWNKLKDEAAQRLQTIKEYNDLGSGMQIALRDLEIRGAGDILGARQSGHIAAVGFHLYTQLLSQAVNRQKGEISELTDDAQEPTITIDLPVQAFIPTTYIADMGLRLQLYRRMADLENDDAIDELGSELSDRFGPLPETAVNLLYQIKVKRLAQAASATAVGNESEQVFVRLPYLAEINRPALQRYLGNDVRVSRTAVWLGRALSQDEWQDRLMNVLHKLDKNTLQAEIITTV